MTPPWERGIGELASRPADETTVSRAGITFVLFSMAGPLVAEPPTDGPRADDADDFLSVLGLTRRADPAADIWRIAEPPAPFAWMTAADPLPSSPDIPAPGPSGSFQQLLDPFAPPKPLRRPRKY